MESEKISLTNFENTEIAFRDQSNASLNQAYQLFKAMNNRALVNLGKHLVNFAFTLHLPIEGIIRSTIYKHFVGGVSIEDCGRTIDRLAQRNVGAILDYAQEGEETEEAFDATCDEIIRTIEYAAGHGSIPFSAFKITGIGRFDLLAKVSGDEPLSEEEKKLFQRIEERTETIFRRGYELGVPVLIDAEETWIQPVLDEMVMRFMSIYNKEKAIVQNTYQMYRHDSLDRIKQHHQMALDGGFKFGLKIVRGAYMEKERARAEEMGYTSPIQPDKQSTDRDFNEAIRYFMAQHESIDFTVATHNEESSLLLARLIDEANLERGYRGIYFAQLYGMSDHITYQLADAGYNVVKYVPYGAVKTVMPYLFRRAEENSSVKGQSSRELMLIRAERRRRKQKTF